MTSFKDYLVLFFKGVAMGAANVIPGVSGGTIAFVTGIYEELIESLKSFNTKGLKLLFNGKVGEFLEHIHFKFLTILFLGVGVSIVSLGKLLEFLFNNAQLLVWAFFFGLIIASVYYVGRMIKEWGASTVASFIVGTAIAVSLAFIKPASESEAYLYVFICGIVAISSMLLPGLSGSFILILMGNYQLIMLEAVPSLDWRILLPFAGGAIIGFLLLSHVISFLLEKAYNQTVALLTGFILGSLIIIWPWKNDVYLTNSAGEFILKHDEKIVQGYDYYTPDLTQTESFYAIGLIILGILAVVVIEKLGGKKAAK